MPYNAWVAMAFYSVSCILDAVDGHAARYFNQTSSFGAVLDMVTDRSTTACLLVFLSVQNPSMTLLFQSLIALDLSSHYMHMYASLTSGSSSHKKLDKKSNWLLRQYYTNSNVLFLVCAGNELCFIALYLLGQLGKEVDGLKGSAPAALAATHVLDSAATELGKQAAAAGVGAGLQFAKVLLWVTLPVCIFKNVLNVVQLVGASKTLAKADLENRRKLAADKGAKSR
ncbi:hypothetical protein HK097_002428 [Rhizophlyctis rosea]|uniref:CDP-diacylglycerol--inositol 3-phosphatidyltransferase n=1 Tax=Rhizophlyctis rosea TaxID=64517 RepID=A0AAD5SFI3_9FUNG|nr:hypothetical protein HK097_002428 [Rhizophlyctis rosea]